MEPLIVLVLMPVAVGCACELLLRDARRASLAAGVATLLLLAASVQWHDATAGWHWVAAALVSPLPIALAVGTALFLYDRFGARY
ncbi:MAG: hypothetical protein IT520_03520 [Burkholderiales bacterium]|nr:hypothetical protein [Burkholderiales bacterium]